MAARGVQGLIAVTALMGLAACGSVSAGGAGNPASTSGSANSSSAPAAGPGTSSAAAGAAGGSLCANGQGADRVVVSRTRLALTRPVTLTGTTQVQAMIAALCALPALPAGQHCAAAASVRLVFAAGDQSFPPVIVQQTGCRSVTGVGTTTRWWSGSSHLGVLLDEALGGTGRLAPGVHPSSVPTGP
jgi:hypothetical protein